MTDKPEEKDELKEFLDGLKLERYYDLLQDEGYETNEDILTMELEDIKDLDIKVPHRKRILAEVQKLKKRLGVDEEEEEFTKSATPLKKEPTTNTSKIEEKISGESIKEIDDTPKKSPIITANVENKERMVNSSPPSQEISKSIKMEPYVDQNTTPIKTNTSNTSTTSMPKIVINTVGTGDKNFMDLLSSYNPNLLPTAPITSYPGLTKSLNPTLSDLSSYNPNPSPSTRNTSSTVFNTSSPSYTPSPTIYSTLPTLTPTKNVKKIDYQELKRLNGLLLNCCQMGNLESAIQYVEQGADDLDKSLACASSGGHKKLAMYLIEKGAKDFNKAFLSACKSGNLEMMLEMYKRGANNLQEGLKEAKLKKHKNLVFQLEKLISQKDQIDPQKIEVDNVLTLRQMNSLLLNYSQIGNFDMVKKYVENGANNLDKALCCACSGGQKQIVQYLIDKGAKDFDGAFLTACKSGNREMALEMIKRGAKNLELGLEIAKKRENEDMQYDIRLALYQLNAN